MILVVGATGILGGEICRRLAERGRPVRALTRPTSAPEKVEPLRALGAEIALGDLKDRASLDAACRGADVVISTATTTMSRQPDDSIDRTDGEGQRALIDAARAAGVRQFIYVSFSGNVEIDSPLTRAKRGTEAHLRASGLTYTILRPSYFMEIWLSPMLGFDYQQGTAQVYGTGDHPGSWISLGDVAAFAVGCVDNPAAANAVLELGGPEALSELDVVRVFEETTGRPMQRQHVPEEVLEAQWRAAEDPMQKTFAALTLALARGDAIDVRPALAAVPVRLTSVRDYAARVTAGLPAPSATPGAVR